MERGDDSIIVARGPKIENTPFEYDIYYGHVPVLNIQLPPRWNWMTIIIEKSDTLKTTTRSKRMLSPEELAFYPLDSLTYDLYTEPAYDIGYNTTLYITLPVFSYDWNKAVIYEIIGCVPYPKYFRKNKNKWVFIKPRF